MALDRDSRIKFLDPHGKAARLSCRVKAQAPYCSEAPYVHDDDKVLTATNILAIFLAKAAPLVDVDPRFDFFVTRRQANREKALSNEGKAKKKKRIIPFSEPNGLIRSIGGQFILRNNFKH